MVKNSAILITAYCGGNDPVYYTTGNEEQNAKKRHMAKTLARHLGNLDYHVCMSSHSALDMDTQRACSSFIYDSDNSWQICGLPLRPNHGVAEMTAIVNGLMMLKTKGFDWVLKLNYDQTPTLDYDNVIKTCSQLDADLATYENATDYGMMVFWGNIDFIIDSLPLDRLQTCEGAVETCWYNKIADSLMKPRVHGFASYEQMFAVPDGTLLHHSYVGSALHEYNYQ